MNTLWVLLIRAGLSVELGSISLAVNDCSPTRLRSYLKKLIKSEPIDATELATFVKNKFNEKHDVYLNEVLLCQNYASRYLDTNAAWNVIQEILRCDRTPKSESDD